jgi:phasin family protein
MPRKAAATPKADHGARAQSARKRSGPRARAEAPNEHNASGSSESARSSPDAASMMPGFADLSKMATMMTPEQAIALYKTNAALALAVINTAIEGTARVRRKQLEGEEAAREFQRKQARSAAEARDPQALLAMQQGAAQEAMEKSMHYWSEMFDLIVEIQKRLFALMQDQMEGVPGVRETRAAMAMLPDLTQMQKVVSAMQGVVSSGGSTFESMQRVMGDFAKLAQGSMMTGGRR